MSFSAGFQALRPPCRSGHGRQAQPRQRPASRQPLLACTPLAMGLPHAALAPTHGPGTPAPGLPCVSCMPWDPAKSLGNRSSRGSLAREGSEGRPGRPGPGQWCGEREAERAHGAGAAGRQPAQLSSSYSSICTCPRRSSQSRHSRNVPEHHKSGSSEKLSGSHLCWWARDSFFPMRPLASSSPTRSGARGRANPSDHRRQWNPRKSLTGSASRPAACPPAWGLPPSAPAPRTGLPPPARPVPEPSASCHKTGRSPLAGRTRKCASLLPCLPFVPWLSHQLRIHIPMTIRGLRALPWCAADTRDMHLPFAPSSWKHPPGRAGTPTPLCLSALLELVLNTFHVSRGWEPRAAWLCRFATWRSRSEARV